MAKRRPPGWGPEGLLARMEERPEVPVAQHIQEWCGDHCSVASARREISRWKRSVEGFEERYVALLEQRGIAKAVGAPLKRLDPEEVYNAALESRGLLTKALPMLGVCRVTLMRRMNPNDTAYDETVHAAWEFGRLVDAENMIGEVRDIADRCMENGDYKTALQALTRSLEANPKTPDWHRRSRVQVEHSGRVDHSHVVAVDNQLASVRRKMQHLFEPVDVEFKELPP